MKKKAVVLAAALLAMSMTPAYAGKKIPSASVTLRCPDQPWNSYVTYKLDKKNLLKYAASNNCSYRYLYARWGYFGKGAKTSHVFVAPDGWTDLWKAELNPLPTRKVDWIDFQYASVPCAVMRKGVKFYVANGDTVDSHVCW